MSHAAGLGPRPLASRPALARAVAGATLALVAGCASPASAEVLLGHGGAGPDAWEVSATRQPGAALCLEVTSAHSGEEVPGGCSFDGEREDPRFLGAVLVPSGDELVVAVGPAGASAVQVVDGNGTRGFVADQLGHPPRRCRPTGRRRVGPARPPPHHPARARRAECTRAPSRCPLASTHQGYLGTGGGEDA